MNSETNNIPPAALLAHLGDATAAVIRCSALISPLYQYADEMENGSTPETAMKLLKLVEIEFNKYEAEMQGYWNTLNRPEELFDQADLVENAQFQLSIYMKIFKNCNWDQVGEGGPGIGVKILKHLTDELCECVTVLHLEAHKLNENSSISSAA